MWTCGVALLSLQTFFGQFTFTFDPHPRFPPPCLLFWFLLCFFVQVDAVVVVVDVENCASAIVQVVTAMSPTRSTNWQPKNGQGGNRLGALCHAFRESKGIKRKR